MLLVCVKRVEHCCLLVGCWNEMGGRGLLRRRLAVESEGERVGGRSNRCCEMRRAVVSCGHLQMPEDVEGQVQGEVGTEA